MTTTPLRTAALTDTGRRRRHNEDAYVCDPPLFAIADGMGGAQAGEIASHLAATSLQHAERNDPSGEEAVQQLIQDANRSVYERARSDASTSGMGTTMTVALVDGDVVRFGHVGDSRAYLWRNGELSRLTVDHTYVQALIDEGKLTREEAAVHPYRSAVLRSIDGEHQPEPDVFWVELELNDRLLVCSDGLTDLVPEPQIGELLSVEDPDLASGALVAAALERGGKDNVTCLVADVADGPALCADGRLLGALGDPYLVVDPAAVRPAQPA
jgi:protein phosphatase